MKKKIRIGLIGCGRVAENHVLAIEQCAWAEITAVSGGRHAKEFGKKLGVPVLSEDEICKSDSVDALCILTPPEFHYIYAMKGIEAGKHILVEKPVSFSEQEIEEMAAVSRKNGVICMPGHSYIYLPELRRMKRVLEEKRLGVPAYMYLSEMYYMSKDLAVKYTGPETDVLCHQLYLCLAFLGMPVRITAFRTQIEGKENETEGAQVSVMLEYEQGTIVQIFVTWAAEDYSSEPWTFKIKILGNKGSMNFSRRDFIEKTDTGYEQSLYQEMFNEEMKWFVERCILQGEQPISTMEDARQVCRLHKVIVKAINEKIVVEGLE